MVREFIVEADGGSRGNPGPAGYGAVVIDAATGETLAETAEYIGVATNNVAEYRGLLAGLKAARALDPAARIRVRMDSKLVVEQMSGRWKIKHPDMKPLAREAAAVFPPSQVTYEWIPRERNKHADRLANEAMDAGKRGERWSPSTSTAELSARTPAPAAPEPTGPPGDAAAGAARARAALAGGRVATSPAVPEPGGTAADTGARAARDVASVPADADVRAARNVASPPADLGAPATFVLLRHGETPLTPQKRFSGSGGSDPALSDVGRRQAELVGAALAARGTIQAVVSSPLARCRETAGIVAARLGIEVSVEEGLRETDFGAWEGLTFGEVRERHPEDMNAWLADPEAEPTGGGESFAAVARRVATTRDKLLAAYAGRTVLLVSHVTPIKTLVRLALDAPPQSLFRMELSAASVSAVAYYADGNASVRLLNDTSHLR
ncbi:phosphoglycerate mutase GpmB [Streptomyces avermitilis]|uniref:Bifunctional protein (Ribonuclease H/phosphoglycerate mutase) n=2 Tax=Streptomyces avermitilis TaxID=33903 RepID=Q82B28_STRAW|nr:putative bifunctional protein (ribonuclease H/phosphoglycerate mutase) [Streptomyces avermitilis MA-4680 = NBRC 14893]BBJ54072.1 bifunctional RNase H/acid phosphatase [Streptomyces avermitilis]GDY66084.1 bifunctional RNase H/acid phosphatase [Streptomyces avermitilis]GDY73697.1 bifunctional RNase H/acid phosphatase [Streptomyces avermitilis]